jgi:hypothetical protein
VEVEVVVEVAEVAAVEVEVAAEEVVAEAEKRESISNINSLSHFSCPMHDCMTSTYSGR